MAYSAVHCRGVLGLQVTYHLFFETEGATVSAKGEKELENGEVISPAGRQPIRIDGTIIGREIVARYDLEPARDHAARPTTGEFRWEVPRTGSYAGAPPSW
jgi:hypothetical protein